MKKTIKYLTILALIMLIGIIVPTISNAIYVGQPSETNEIVENIERETTVYAGEIFVDGESQMQYVYSQDLGNTQIIYDDLRAKLPTKFASLIPGTASEEAAGLAVSTSHQSDMNSSWVTASYVADQYFEGTLGEETTDHLFDGDNRIKSIINLTVQPNGYKMIDGTLTQVTLTTVSYEAITVFYISVNVTTTPAQTYYVEFYTNGAKEEIDDQIVTEGGKAVKPADPTRDYATFVGWYADEDLTEPFDFDKPITSYTEIYAKWDVTEHDVIIKFTDGMNYDVTRLTDEQYFALEVLLYKGLLVEDVNYEDLIDHVYSKDGKLLFIYDSDGIITFAEGVSSADDIVYTLTDEDKENLLVESGDQMNINKIIFCFGDSVYEILDGANQTHKKGDTSNLTFKTNGLLAKLVGIKVDGALVDESNYELSEGSTIATLKADYLNSLTVGEHEITFAYADGEVSTNFTITDSTPKTGDPIILWFILMAVSIAGVITIVIVSKKSKK